MRKTDNKTPCRRRRARVDERDNRYGKLTVIDLAPEKAHCWLAKCDCGGFRLADGRELRAGRIKACKPCAKLTQGTRTDLRRVNQGEWWKAAA